MPTELNQPEFLGSIIDHLPLGMFCKDYRSGTGVFVGWNRAAEQLWGLEKSEVIGKTDFDLFPAHQAEAFKAKDLETIQSGRRLFIAEEQTDSPSLGKRIVRTWKVPFTNRYLLGISEDITENKEMEKKLEDQKIAAIKAAKMASLGEMAGAIAHEVNNPLAIIAGMTQVIAKMPDADWQDRPLFEDRCNKITDTVRRMESIVSGLRNFSRDGSSDDFEDVRVIDLVEDALGICSEKFRTHGVELAVSVGADLKLQCQQTQIEQVIVNLLNNAFTAVQDSTEKKVAIAASVLAEPEPSIVISVTDSGSGVSREDRDNLFKPFFTTKKIGEGTGLGLSISRGIIEKHAGKIELDIECPQTCFVVTLPIGQEGAAN